MKIAISGLTGSGKNAVGERVAKELGIKGISHTFKSLAKEKGIGLLEFQRMAELNPKYDRELDGRIKREAGKGSCVVFTWLGPWIVKADLRVWLNAPEKVRAARIAKRDGMKKGEALRHLRKRDKDNRRRYMRLYGIDIFDHSGFDMELNTVSFTPDGLSSIIIAAAKEKG
jgi:cytidylate kinase